MAGKKRVPGRVKAKHEWKPQGFTKKEWITIGIVLGAIVVLILGYFLLRDFFDGSLRISGGKVQAEANWIVVNSGNTNKPKYFKLGSVSEVEGYTMKAEQYLSDENVPTFQYTPAAAGAINNVTIFGTKNNAEQMARTVATNYTTALPKAVVSEVGQVTVGGRTGWALSCDYEVPQEETAATPAPEATPAAEATPAPTPKVARVVNIYFEASRGMSVLTGITAEADTADQLPSVDDMYKAMEPFVQSLSIDGEVQATAVPSPAA